MTESQAHKQAAKQSKNENTSYVVWVFDQGRDVFDQDQMRIYEKFCDVEATYWNGVRLQTPEDFKAAWGVTCRS